MYSTKEVIYAYSFSVWPDENYGFNAAVHNLFRMLTGRVEINMTEMQFNQFRLDLFGHGLTLREVERAVYSEPEPIID